MTDRGHAPVHPATPPDSVDGLRGQHHIHDVLAEAVRRLAAARDVEEVQETACDAALALLKRDPKAGAALLVDSEAGLVAAHTVGTLSACEALTIAPRTLSDLAVTSLANGHPVTEIHAITTLGLSMVDAGTDALVLAPVMSHGRLYGVLAATADAATDVVSPLAVLAGTVGLALDADRHGWAEAIIEQVQDIVLVLGPDGTIRTANAAAGRTLGLDPGALVGSAVAGLIHPDDTRAFLRWLGRAGDRGPSAAYGVRCRHGDGGWVEVDATATAMFDASDLRGIVVNLRDVGERKTLEAELSHRRLHDALTNLPNRAALCKRIATALDAARRTAVNPAVLLVDLDDFKSVNDSLGHHEGDRLLIVVAERLRRCLRPGDVVARLGDDEFVVLIDDAASAEEVAGRILTNLHDPVALHLDEVHTCASIGIRVAEPADHDVEQLLRDADLAMYAAKAAGKATWRTFTPEMHEQVLQQLTLRSDLRRAIDHDQFVLHYQSIVEVETCSVVGFEALIRWQHPHRGLVGPDEFITEAERTGLIVPIGERAIAQACAAAVELRAATGRDLTMSVNLSPRQLTSDDIVAVVRQVLRDSQLPPAALCLEITESVVADERDLVDRLQALRQLGVAIAIDDFGTGFSSYAHLQTLPVDVIKIDRSFIEQLGTEEPTAALAAGIVRMSEALGLRTIAEGVETAEQWAALRRLGCPLAQGFLFARPVDLQGARMLLTSDEQRSRLVLGG